MKLPIDKQLARGWLIVWGSGVLIVSAWSMTQSGASTHDLTRALTPPGSQAWLGTDAFGRDLGFTVLRASATSTLFSLATVAISSVTAGIIGAGIAMSHPWVRFFGLRFLETLLAFPSILFALGFAAIRGPGWDTLLGSLLLGALPSFSRLLYVRTTELLSEDYVLAAKALGAEKIRVLVKHLAPHLLVLCRINAPNLFAHTLLAEATLSFLGIGAPIGRDTWGSLLAQGRDYLFEMPHIALVAGIPLLLTVLSLQLLSETK